MKSEVVVPYCDTLTEMVEELKTTTDPVDVAEACQSLIHYAKALKQLAEADIKRNIRFEGRDAD